MGCLEVITDLDDEQGLHELLQDEHYIIYIDTHNLCTQQQLLLRLLDFNIYQYLDPDDELVLLDPDDQLSELDDELDETDDLFDQLALSLILHERCRLQVERDELEVLVLEDEEAVIEVYSLEYIIH